MKYLYDPPLVLKKIFNDFYWHTNNNKVLLTFDDGPNPGTTELILKELSDRNIRALFFCVGENAQKYPDLIKSIISEGHSIGNHTFNHKIITRISKQESVEQIKKTNLLFEEKFNLSLTYFRPAHGKFKLSTSKLLSEQKLKNVMWSLLTYDYKNELSIVKFVVKYYLNKNSIIVLHDSNKSKSIIVDSINTIAEEAEKRNFMFGDAKECLS